VEAEFSSGLISAWYNRVHRQAEDRSDRRKRTGAHRFQGLRGVTRGIWDLDKKRGRSMQVRKVKLERSGNWDKNKKEVCWRQDKEKRKESEG
jgi:hypothetical protein